MHFYEVDDGIFINMECSGIIKINKGIFIPYWRDSREEEMRKELEPFLQKWFWIDKLDKKD
jgi:hypothetical protein